MELVHACFRTSKDPESSFHHCSGLVELVRASFRARKDLERTFHNCGGAVKLVPASFSARKDLERSFHCCGRLCGARTYLFQYQERSRKQFSPLGCPRKVVQPF